MNRKIYGGMLGGQQAKRPRKPLPQREKGLVKNFSEKLKKTLAFSNILCYYMGVASEDDKNWIVGVDDDEGPPVPIPNTEVKLISAEDTWLATARDNRKVPTSKQSPNRVAVFL